MPSRLAILALDPEGLCSRDVKVIKGFIRGRGPKDGDGGRSGVHSGVKMIWGPEGDIAVPKARSAWLKACLGEGCYERRDSEDIQVRKSECFALFKPSG